MWTYWWLYEPFLLTFENKQNANSQVSKCDSKHWTIVQTTFRHHKCYNSIRKTQQFIGIWSSQSSRKHFDENVKEKSIKLINHYAGLWNEKAPYHLAIPFHRQWLSFLLPIFTPEKYFKAKIVIMPLWCATNKVHARSTNQNQVKNESLQLQEEYVHTHTDTLGGYEQKKLGCIR